MILVIEVKVINMMNMERINHFLEQRLSIAETCGCRCVVETKTIEALRKSVEWLKNNGVLDK